MNVLVIGSGGREHALVWKLRQSPVVTKLFCAPGNAGIAAQAAIVPIGAGDIGGLLKFAIDEKIDLVVVGPEQPLTEGIVDRFEAEGLKIFGPAKAAARIEGSKIFAKNFMQKYSIPTADFRTFSAAEKFDAGRYLSEVPTPIVIKADGLAAGKGVTVCESRDRAIEVLDALMERKTFGDSGSSVVIEECLAGEEASVLVLTDGGNYVTLPPAQDHKRILDNDMGKNTGGMGAYAPAPAVTPEILETVGRTIVRPTLDGMRREGHPFRGCLYVGLMITQTGPKVIEYNCRFGDPETQAILPLVQNDLAILFREIASGALESPLAIADRTAVCVVIASRGYPDDYETGKPIMGLERVTKEHDVVVFHAGTKSAKDGIVTSGGRVLGVTASSEGADLEGAIDKAYRAVGEITFDGAYYRSDIGKKGLLRGRQPDRGNP
ncbi:MAG TPA: phosphoribosylamine--glycine ligase [Bacteroidota bacterium]|nr:phosphoribosylamine--glycine ligase [Bacteroidota bacterium]